jgi:hypothetical protein
MARGRPKKYVVQLTEGPQRFDVKCPLARSSILTNASIARPNPTRLNCPIEALPRRRRQAV